MTPEQQALTDQLRDHLNEFADRVQAVSGKPQPDGEWPLGTILLHLWLVEEVLWQARLEQMAAEDNPRWQWTEPDLQAAVAKYGNLPDMGLFEMFGQRRFHTIQGLRGLDAAGWARIGTHSRFGPMDVADLCARILEHDDEHLEELKKRAL
jgi:hypothetical protein